MCPIVFEKMTHIRIIFVSLINFDVPHATRIYVIYKKLKELIEV